MTTEQKNTLKLVVIMACSVFPSYIVVLQGPKIVASAISSFAIPALGILSGLIIGAIGVFLGGIGNLYSMLQMKCCFTLAELEDFLYKINRSVKELKQNVLFVIIAMMFSSFLLLLQKLDLPRVRWPFDSIFLSKLTIVNTIVLSTLILVFVAIFDSINAMFKIHSIYEIQLKASFNSTKS